MTLKTKAPFWVKKAVDILHKNWAFGTLCLQTPDGQDLRFVGAHEGPTATLIIKNYRALNRVIMGGDIGFFEAYRDGDWDTPDLEGLLSLLSQNLDQIKTLQDGGWVMNLINGLYHFLRPNSKEGSKKNILAHYDLGNSFYQAWLDPSMTYSAAVFDKDHCLETAQARKYDDMAHLAGLKAGDHVLEIGCGWGGFACYAARHFNVQVTALTISDAQYDFAIQRVKDAGLQDRVSILKRDYRDIEGQFDAIVSIEMFEAVGEAYWQTYFDKIKACLKDGAKAALQIITIRDELFSDYRSRTDFIQKYVFPGGMLPSPSKLEALAGHKGLRISFAKAFGHDYARTLRLWAERFETAWKQGHISGFDIGFARLWRFYLAYCAAGFNSRRTDVVHLALQR